MGSRENAKKAERPSRQAPEKRTIAATRRLRPPGGWPDFAWELTIVVLGVLIALVIGQAAQWWKDRSDAAEARTNIRGEIATNLARLANRARIRGCIERRMNEIDSLLARSASGQPFVRSNWIGRPQTWNMYRSRLDAAMGGGRASLLTSDEQSAYSDFYAAFAAIERAQDREQSAWAQLRGLEGMTSLSPTDAAAMRSAIQEARLQNWRIHIAAQQARELAAQLEISSIVYPRRGSRSLCLPITMPRIEALRRLDSDYGEP